MAKAKRKSATRKRGAPKKSASRAAAPAPAPEEDPSPPEAVMEEGDEDQVDQPCKVLCHVSAVGERGAMKLYPLHEVPLMRRKLQAEANQRIELETDWPEGLARERQFRRGELYFEYHRLHDYYEVEGERGQIRNLVDEVYGTFQAGGLLAAVDAMYAKYLEVSQEKDDTELTVEDLMRILAAGDPEFGREHQDVIDAESVGIFLPQ